MTSYVELKKFFSSNEKRSIDTLGKTVSDSITTNISEVSKGNYKLTYSLSASNTYYNIDRYKIITIMGNDNQQRYIFLKNPRTSDVVVNVERIRDTWRRKSS